MGNKDERARMREAKERKRKRLEPYRDAESRSSDISIADQQYRKDVHAKTDGSSEDRADLRKEKVRQRRWRTIDRNTKGRRCPQCRQIILKMSSWIINRKKRVILCKSCYYSKMNNPLREEEFHLTITIFESENRYKIYPNELIQARTEANLTQARFAKVAGWTRSYQAKLESGAFKTVSEEKRNTILEVLKRHKVFTEDS